MKNILKLILLLVFGSLPCMAATSPAMFNCIGGYEGQTTVHAFTLPNPVFAGDGIVAFTDTEPTTQSITDSESSTYAEVSGVRLTTGTTQTSAFFTPNLGSGGSLTVTFHNTTNVFSSFAVCEVAIQKQSATNPGGMIDVSGTGASGSINPASSGSITSTGADLIIGAMWGTTFTPTGGFATTYTIPSTGGSILQTLNQSMGGSIAATATPGGNWRAIIIAIKPLTTAALVSTALTPSNPSIVERTTQQFTLTGTYADTSTAILNGPAAWSSTSTSVATISVGTATAVAPGTTTIGGTFGGFSPTTTLTVTQAPTNLYGGLNAGPSCTNTNTAFTIVTVSSHLVFCTPQGTNKVMFPKGAFVFSFDAIGTLDESGNSYQNYVTTKYSGNLNTWATQETTLMQTWGWNMIQAQASTITFAWNGASIPLPGVLFEDGSHYSLYITPTAAVKDLYYTIGSSGAATTWGGFFRASSALYDFRDPNWSTFINNNVFTEVNSTALAASSTAIKGDLMYIETDDGDGLHCLGAGADFVTQPPGNNDFRCGYVPFFVSSLSYVDPNVLSGSFSPNKIVVYPDGTVYMKKRWRDILQAKYTTIANLNSAWVTSGYYTTFGTSGTCYGSLSPSSVCPSPSAAITVTSSAAGGSQSYSPSLTGSGGNISLYSVYVADNGVIVGGDTGVGTLSGTSPQNVTGTVNYSSGTVSLTMTVTAGHAITMGYCKGCWGIGTGLLDEDCRSAHSAWCGTGSGTTTICSGLTSSNAVCPTLPGLPTNVIIDINAFTQDWATYYYTQWNAAIQTWTSTHGFTGHVLYCPGANGSWTTPADQYVLTALNGNADLVLVGGQGVMTQAEVDFFHTYSGNLPFIDTSYRSANAQSPLSWPNSSCTHSGINVNCTMATPNKFAANASGFNIDTICNNSDYTLQIGGYSYSGTTLSYTKSPAPTNSSATCNVFFDDNNVGGFASQAARGADFQSGVTGLWATCYTSGGVCPYAGYAWWGYYTDWREGIDWGIVTVRDNPDNNHDNVNSTVTCTNNTSYSCGGELSLHNPPLGDVISYVTATDTTLDNDVIGLAGGTPFPPAVEPGGFVNNPPAPKPPPAVVPPVVIPPAPVIAANSATFTKVGKGTLIQPPPPPAILEQGNWAGLYGADGYWFANSTKQLPAYAVVSTSGNSTWTWAPNTTDFRGLLNGSNRIAACWYGQSYSFDVNFTDGKIHPFTLYLVDWDSTTRAETIYVTDSITGKLLDVQHVTAFNGGEYLQWQIGGHVKVQVSCDAGANAVVSGMFFN